MRQVSRTFPQTSCCLQHTITKGVTAEREGAGLKFSEILPTSELLWNIRQLLGRERASLARVTPCFCYGILKQAQKNWIGLSLFGIGNEKLVVMQFKQKKSFKIIGPSEIDWIWRKMCIFLLPLNSRKRNWMNFYIEPRIAVYLNYIK